MATCKDNLHVREKLVELIKEVPYGVSVGATFERYFCEKIATHLIANGVTVQECGEWEWRGGIPWCSVCGEMPLGYSYDGDVNTSPYCPSCGARLFPQPPKGE